MSEIKTDLLMPANITAENSLVNQGSSKAKELAARSLNSDKDVEKAASQFEALLLHQMLKSMWSTVEGSGLMGENSNEARIYRDMFLQSVADETSEGRGIGIKDFLQKELLRKGYASK